jgi:hypothetical protein
MRRWFVMLAAASIALGLASAVNAAPLNWEGSLSVDIADNPPVLVFGGGVATVNASAGAIPAHLVTLRLAASRGNVAGTETVFITDPDIAANGVAAIAVDADLGTGVFAPVSGGVASTGALTRDALPMRGLAKICVLSTSCTSYVELALTEPTTVNGVPGSGIRGIGIGGLLTAGGYGGIRISLQAAPWTVKTATVFDQITTTGGQIVFTPWVASGWAHAPASTTSSSAQPGGVVQLVTPGQIETNLPLGTSDKMAGMVVLVVRFIPEPGLLLLLGSGIAGLGVLGHRRPGVLRKRSSLVDR